ncbi:sigma 54-interacting transcriptional regulator [Sporosarcina sp. ACRSL]|uniref:sigma-54 interaction domain-containing protein n=1 Tax=Sporosarcina sp. ACRSL TaxID=2918215 RepID=UPI001EF66D4D|nr:sigma 54-interacting transcriptional regulator [Sporosarcina sp. ACRSL]MCG7346138.1 sigma 54-interacting transcriptional regulator [Sporosarcina sp. ACRSL]
MNSTQHLLEKVMDTDFYIMDAQIDQASLKEKIMQETPTKIFLQDNHTVQYVQLSETTSELFYDPCPVYPITSPIEHIVSTLTHDNHVLLTDDKGIYAGFVNTEILSKKLLNEYQQMQAYLDTILQTIDESCTVIDRDTNVVYWTKGAEKIFSIKAKDIIGKPITDFFNSDQLEILNTLKSGSSVYHRQHHARNDLAVMINSNPVYYNDEIIGAVVSETDITSQIRLNNELFMTSEKLFSLEEEVRKSLPTVNPFSYIKGNSPALKETMSIAEKAATTNVSVLIYGESGVGKELFAKAIHHLREKPNAPFVAINCGAIPSGLFESEIFGYEKGAFSGADQKGKKGKVELARGGTLFLDEIGEMPLEMQVKILRLLQEKKFYPVGGTKEIEADFRVVAATNRDLKELVKEGKFREDLYYRLNVVNFKVPPLRERPEDIIELTHYFLYEISVKYNRPIHGISQAVMQSLLRHSWPGNIRELRNVVERLVVFSDNGNIKLEDLPIEMERISNPSSPTPDLQHAQLTVDENLSLSEQLQQYEKDIILRELSKVNGNKLECAKNLNITRATLYNRMNRLGIK